ncbi:MAG: hypothetical protein D6732_11990 [Methanobacteriota archaeon]|nr:MAG: hypothetical protein D6732_11990 [Euryarchaeota archaeon]
MGIPVYVVFNDHLPEPEIVKAHFLKVIYKSKGGYSMKVLREWCCSEEDNTIDLDKTIDIDILPFRLGIKKLKDKYWRKGKKHDLFQLILIDRKTGKPLKTKAEKAEEERRRAEEERNNAEEERKKAEEKVRKLQEELEKIKNKK